MRANPIVQTLLSMLQHPIGKQQKLATLSRFVRWQLGSRILGASVAMPFLADTRLITKTGMHGATMNLYVGLHEFEEMSFLLHLLNPSETFVDVGANVGVYTVLAAGVRKANVISVEPVPETYEQLMDNVHLNRLDSNVTAHNIGLAGEKGKLRFSVSKGSGNHVLNGEDNVPAIKVPVDMLDSLAEDSKPVLIKIDVEGFEHEVLRGGQRILNSSSLLALIVELNGLGKRYGFADNLIDFKLRKFGFVPASYKPFERRLTELSRPHPKGNTIYVRSPVNLAYRMQKAKPFNLYKHVF
jgi:FkbM family methyltransferase